MDDPTPQKLLMSLRTPSTSFEEKKESDGASLVLSPDDPPKILSSTQQQRAVEMFEVRTWRLSRDMMHCVCDKATGSLTPFSLFVVPFAEEPGWHQEYYAH
jgi:hypothetical protein